MSHHFIEFSNVKFTYPSGQEALRGVSFRITHGEKVALLGLNGAGKSTILQLTNGLLLPSSGEVNIGGVPVTKKTLSLVRKAIGMVFQNPDDQLFMPTVEEDVAFGPANMRLPLEEIRKRVREALTDVEALDLIHRSPAQLSGGQKRRVAIATVLSMKPDILVLDEPTSNLDWKARRSLMEIIRGFSHTCLIATHDLGLVKEMCQRTIIINKGEIIADSKTQHILSDRKLLEMLGIKEEDLCFTN